MTETPYLLEYLRRLEPHDASVAVAVCELLHRADASGRAERGEWLASVRDAYRRLSERYRDSGRAPGMSDLPAEQLGRYIEEHVIERLEGAAIARRIPPDESWEHFGFDPGLWSSVLADRETVTARADGVVRALLAGERAEPGVAPAAARALGESRLRGDGLTKIYRRRKVVNQVDIAVQQGEIVGLLGPNGAGKTTTFYMIVGLIAPNEGRVFLDGGDLTDTPMYRRARLGIGYLAQEPSVFRKLAVEENVMAILETLPLSRRERAQRLEELLSELSIAHLRRHKAYSLSGGERRRLEITRALVRSPKFMLLDEPFAGIDPIAVNDIQQIVAGLRRRGIGVIITDHNVEQTLDIVDRAYIMYEGRIRISGTVSELVWNEEVAEIYLGPTLTQRMRQRYPQPNGKR